MTEPLAITVAQIAIGFFFASSGFHKLVYELDHEKLVALFVRAGIPLPRIAAALVPGVELVTGLMLIIGLGTVYASAILIAVMAVAIATVIRVDIWKATKPLDWADWLAHWIYQPEVLLILLLAIFATA